MNDSMANGDLLLWWKHSPLYEHGNIQGGYQTLAFMPCKFFFVSPASFGVSRYVWLQRVTLFLLIRIVLFCELSCRDDAVEESVKKGLEQ